MDEVAKLTERGRLLEKERNTIRERLLKLKKRKGKIDFGLKLCKNCGSDYQDSENYNWSCRFHLYPIYNDVDEFWWCCTKKGKDALGC